MDDDDVCPTCGQDIPANLYGRLVSRQARIDETLERLRATCRERGFWVSVNEEIRSTDAAELLGVDGQTLRQRRYNGDGIPYRQVGRHVLYRLEDLAKFL